MGGLNEESYLYSFAAGSLPCLDQNLNAGFLRSLINPLGIRGAKMGGRILRLASLVGGDGVC